MQAKVVQKVQTARGHKLMIYALSDHTYLPVAEEDFSSVHVGNTIEISIRIVQPEPVAAEV
jgi:hypothetical protein